MIREELRYAESHEWARIEENTNQVTVGISDFAVEQLGDIVYLELPNMGDELKKGSPFGTIESIKTPFLVNILNRRSVVSHAHILPSGPVPR